MLTQWYVILMCQHHAYGMVSLSLTLWHGITTRQHQHGITCQHSFQRLASLVGAIR